MFSRSRILMSLESDVENNENFEIEKLKMDYFISVGLNIKIWDWLETYKNLRDYLIGDD